MGSKLPVLKSERGQRACGRFKWDGGRPQLFYLNNPEEVDFSGLSPREKTDKGKPSRAGHSLTERIDGRMGGPQVAYKKSCNRALLRSKVEVSIRCALTQT